jgi:hypothetical protein
MLAKAAVAVIMFTAAMLQQAVEGGESIVCWLRLSMRLQKDVIEAQQPRRNRWRLPACQSKY